MSYLATAWASMSAPIADVNEFAVLMMLAEKAGPDGCTAFPSQPTIAARTRIAPRTVKRALQRMEERKLIAEGDQKAAAYIRADRRPTVYDLLIPCSWYSAPQLAEVNQERAQRGLSPLTPENRPDIEAAPEKSSRSDTGKPAPQRGRKQRGVSETTRSETARGVSETPGENAPRGVSETATGCLEDRYGVSQSHPREVLDPVPESSSQDVPQTDAPNGDRKDDDDHEHAERGKAAPSLPAARQHPDGSEPAPEAVDLVAALPGMDRKGPKSRARLHAPVAAALASGWTSQALAAHLRREVNPSKVTALIEVYGKHLADLPAPPAPRSTKPPADACPTHPGFVLVDGACPVCPRPAAQARPMPAEVRAFLASPGALT